MREVQRGATFTFMSDLSFIACILFANVNFTHVKNTRHWKSTLMGGGVSYRRFDRTCALLVSFSSPKLRSLWSAQRIESRGLTKRITDLGTRMVSYDAGLVLCRKNDVRLERN